MKGGSSNKNVIKTLFAYKMAYSMALDFYSKGGKH
jgi:hypothetical protein